MSTCVTCGSYYRKSVYNNSDECNDCLDIAIDILDNEDQMTYDESTDPDVFSVVNPSGKTRAVFYDHDVDSFSS